MLWISKSRYRGTMLLAAAIFLVGMMNFLIHQYRLEPFPEPNRETEIRLLDSLLAQLHHPAENYREKENRSEGSPETTLRPFNPNTIERADWLQMGLPLRAFESLERYRKKGGVFRSSEQVYKIPHLSRELAQGLEKLVRPDTGSTVALRKDKREKKPKVPAEPFDLNLADSLQLRSIFGIGAKTAARILKYRSDLGGFIRKEQLYEVWHLDSLVAEELMDQCFISQPPVIRKINPNKAGEEELMTHPYIRKGLGRLIVRYRKQHPHYTKAEDLLGIRLFRPEQLEKLRPYLSFD